MPTLKINSRNQAVGLIILAAAILRLSTTLHIEYNPLVVFTPIGAMALFGGAYFTGNSKPFAFPLLTLFLSDLVLSFTVYAPFRSGLLYSGWFWIYLAFALMTFAGKLIIKHGSPTSIVWAVLVTVLIHWLVADIGGCIKTNGTETFLSVYGRRLVTAIPYELRFFAGTALYSAVMFGSFKWMQRKNPSLKPEACKTI
jgi:hypothetical protein